MRQTGAGQCTRSVSRLMYSWDTGELLGQDHAQETGTLSADSRLRRHRACGPRHLLCLKLNHARTLILQRLADTKENGAVMVASKTTTWQENIDKTRRNQMLKHNSVPMSIGSCPQFLLRTLHRDRCGGEARETVSSRPFKFAGHTQQHRRQRAMLEAIVKAMCRCAQYEHVG